MTRKTDDDRSKMIGKNIQTARNSRNLTQEKLGALMGVDGTLVSKWENGKGQDASTIEKLARVMGVRVGSLTGDGAVPIDLVSITKGNPKAVALGDFEISSLFRIAGAEGVPFQKLSVGYNHDDFVMPNGVTHEMYASFIQELKAKKGKKFFNGPVIRLLEISDEDGAQLTTGHELHSIRLELGPLSWFQFSAFNTPELLDRAIFPADGDGGTGTTLRSRFARPVELYGSPLNLRWCQLSNLLTLHMTPVTTDRYGLYQERGTNQSAADLRLGSGMTENMHRWLDEAPAANKLFRIHELISPEEVKERENIDDKYNPAEGRKNIVSPYLTAMRGAYEEISTALLAVLTEDPKIIKFTNVFFDLELFIPKLVGIFALPFTRAYLEKMMKNHAGSDNSEGVPRFLLLDERDDELQRVVRLKWDAGGLASLISALRYQQIRDRA